MFCFMCWCCPVLFLEVICGWAQKTGLPYRFFRSYVIGWNSFKSLLIPNHWSRMSRFSFSQVCLCSSLSLVAGFFDLFLSCVSCTLSAGLCIYVAAGSRGWIACFIWFGLCV